VNPRGRVHERELEDWPPLWRDLRAVATYPLRGSNGAAVVGLTAVSLLLPVPVMRILAVLFLLLAVPKHALDVLRDTAHGHREPPAFGFDTPDRVVFAWLGILLAFALVRAALGVFGQPAAAEAWTWLMVVALPLVAMSLALDGQLWRALNPLLWLQVWARIGLPYVMVVAMVWLGLALVLHGAALLDNRLPLFVGTALSTAVALWGTFAAAHICGRLIYQHREALGFTADGPEEPKRLLHSRDGRLEDAVVAMLEAGDAASARRALHEEIRERAVSSPLHKRYRDLLHADGDLEALLVHGRQWLHQRIVEGDARGALALAQECFDLDAGFAAMDAADWPPVIAAAARAGMPRLAEAARIALEKAAPSVR